MSDPFDWNDAGGVISHEIHDNHGHIFRSSVFYAGFFIIVVIATVLFILRSSRRNFNAWGFYSFETPHAPLTPPSPQGLEPETIRKLPTVLHEAKSEQDSARECCICLSAFRNGEKLKVLPGCEHRFHCECVDNWLRNNCSCPLCRASLKLHSSFPTILIQEPPIRHP